MMIDVDTLKAKMIKYGFHAPDMTVTEFVEDMLPTVEAIPKAEYEARLKADLKAILVELQLEIEELDTPNNGSAYMDCVDIIQQKITALKENTGE